MPRKKVEKPNIEEIEEEFIEVELVDRHKGATNIFLEDRQVEFRNNVSYVRTSTAEILREEGFIK